MHTSVRAASLGWGLSWAETVLTPGYNRCFASGSPQRDTAFRGDALWAPGARHHTARRVYLFTASLSANSASAQEDLCLCVYVSRGWTETIRRALRAAPTPEAHVSGKAGFPGAAPASPLRALLLDAVQSEPSITLEAWAFSCSHAQQGSPAEGGLGRRGSSGPTTLIFVCVVELRCCDVPGTVFSCWPAP